jgi:hypothetical protein
MLVKLLIHAETLLSRPMLFSATVHSAVLPFRLAHQLVATKQLSYGMAVMLLVVSL